MKPDLPVWRSLMYVPVNVEKYVDKAHTRGADVIQLDVEDSVPPVGKGQRAHAGRKRTRRASNAAAPTWWCASTSRCRWRCATSKHSICPDVDGIAITKAAGVSHVRLLDELVSELEQKRGMTVGHTKFITMIETPEAFFAFTKSPRRAAHRRLQHRRRGLRA